MTTQQLMKHWQKIIDGKRLDLEAAIAVSREQIRICEKFGGLANRNDICDILGVSAARVSVLIGRGQFRECPLGFSLADVQAYKKGRKNGRPKKTV